MRIDILTLFPEMCDYVLSQSVIGRARERGLIEIYCRNIRKYASDKHAKVDDSPYGGGSGMVMQADPVFNCFESLCFDLGKRPHLIYLSPQGEVLTQKKASRLLEYDNIALLCGHYEGIDERVLEEIVDEEISIGDYVVTGGEIPAVILTDCVCRMVPGVLSSEEGFVDESHFSGLLEHPQYTRPEVWHGKRVPDVLLSGHHLNIEKWRRAQQLIRTAVKRPDMLSKYGPDRDEEKIISDFLNDE